MVPPRRAHGFPRTAGDVHIKYGYIQGDDRYVIKIASSFHENPKNNLPSSNGLMLLFNRKTGGLEAILADEGYLTDGRKAVAGAVVAKYMVPRNVRCVGIVGAGVQGRLQLQFLKEVVACRDVIVWGRDQTKLAQYRDDMAGFGYNISTTTNIDDVTGRCNLIVTTTPSKLPLLFEDAVRKGTHITAVGADTREKQELDVELLRAADVVVADSLGQCLDHGELAHAGQAGVLRREKVVELGNLIKDPRTGRTHNDPVTVADLTRVAVQDLQIARIVLERISAR